MIGADWQRIAAHSAFSNDLLMVCHCLILLLLLRLLLLLPLLSEIQFLWFSLEN
jgi:hypothetical protein